MSNIVNLADFRRRDSRHEVFEAYSGDITCHVHAISSERSIDLTLVDESGESFVASLSSEDTLVLFNVLKKLLKAG